MVYHPFFEKNNLSAPPLTSRNVFMSDVGGGWASPAFASTGRGYLIANWFYFPHSPFSNMISVSKYD
jgi:hypothetical protein